MIKFQIFHYTCLSIEYFHKNHKKLYHITTSIHSYNKSFQYCVLLKGNLNVPIGPTYSMCPCTDLDSGGSAKI